MKIELEVVQNGCILKASRFSSVGEEIPEVTVWPTYSAALVYAEDFLRTKGMMNIDYEALDGGEEFF